MSILKHLKDFVRRKQPELFSNNSWILHEDNVSTQQARIIVDYLIIYQVDTIEQLLFLLDLALCFFFLFPKLKSLSQGKKIESLVTMKKLKLIPSSTYKNGMDE